MPTYPTNKTFRGGFYSNKNVNGVDDRVYTAEDIRKPYDVIYSDGIKPDVDGTAGETLQVSVVNGLTIRVGSGYAKLGGAWFENSSPYEIVLDNPQSTTRYDCVIVRNDDNDSVREPSIYIKSLDHIPTNSDVVRSGRIYEICLAYVIVSPTTSILNDTDIVDMRTSGYLCNIMSGVGATVVKTYRNTYYSESPNQSWLPIGIEQYKQSTDELLVYVEGEVFTEGSQYTIKSDVNVQLTIPLPVVGTKVEFVVHKNVNGSANESTTQEVDALVSDISDIKKTLEHHYYCNGTNDNVLIGDLVRSLLSGSGYGSVKLNIHGTFGAYEPAITANTTDYWFDFNVTSDRQVVVDFTDCSQLITPVTNGKTSVIFYGKKINIVGANLVVSNVATDTAIVGFDGSAEIINCENCRFWITGYKYSYISRTGTFTNCRGSVTNSRYYSYCFNTSGVVRIIGGEYYAYAGDSTAFSAVVGQTVDEAVTIMYGVNAPKVTRSGYYQTNAIKQMAGNYISCTDLITTLELSVISGASNIRGTIPYNKPNMM